MSAELGEWLLAARRGLELSQEQLEEESGVAQSTMSKLEAGKGKLESPSLAALRRMCSTLGISILEAYHLAGLLDTTDEADAEAIRIALAHRICRRPSGPNC